MTVMVEFMEFVTFSPPSVLQFAMGNFDFSVMIYDFSLLSTTVRFNSKNDMRNEAMRIITEALNRDTIHCVYHPGDFWDVAIMSADAFNRNVRLTLTKNHRVR